jgi:hypothetical protein
MQLSTLFMDKHIAPFTRILSPTYDCAIDHCQSKNAIFARIRHELTQETPDSRIRTDNPTKHLAQASNTILHAALAGPLAPAPGYRLRPLVALPLELVVEDAGQHVVAKLRVLQAQRLELVLGLGAQGVRARGPEAGDGRADGGVVGDGVGVDVAGVGNLAAGRRVDAVDLGGGERLEGAEAVALGEGVDARVLEQLVARVVDLGQAGVGLEDALAGDLAGEVLAGVEVLEEAADGVDVVVEELNLAGLSTR